MHRPSGLRPRKGHSLFWMAAFGGLALLFAAGALAARHRLVSVREQIIEAVEQQLGTELRIDSIELFGMRGVRLTGVSIHHETAEGLLLDLHAPVVDAYFDLGELLHGEAAINRLHLENARLLAERPFQEHTDALSERPGEWAMPDWFPAHSFRITGEDCSIELRGWTAKESVVLRETAFDVYRLSRSPSTELALNGLFDGMEERPFQASFSYTSADHFQLEAAIEGTTGEDIEAFQVNIAPVLELGWTNAHIRMDKYPHAPASWLVDFSFGGLDAAETGWATGLVPKNGTIAAQGRYEMDMRQLVVSSALFDSEEVQGDIRGIVSLEPEAPWLDLRVSIDQLPMRSLLDRLAADQMDEFGDIDLELAGLGGVSLSIQGLLSEPAITASLSAGAGTLRFTPRSPSFPAGILQFGLMQAHWDSTTNQATGAFHLTNGQMTHESGIHLENLMGALSIEGSEIQGVGIQGHLNDHRVVGAFHYDYLRQEGKADLSGTMGNLEETPFATLSPNATLAGGFSFEAQGEFSNDMSRFSGTLDATQTAIAYDWFFQKPPGLGAVAAFHGELLPGNTLSMNADLTAIGSEGYIENEWAHDGDAWRLQRSTLTFDTLDIAMIGRCLRLPYNVTGGLATNGSYTWIRDAGVQPDGRTNWHAIGTGQIDWLTIAHPEAMRPMEVRNAQAEVTYQNAEANTGHLALDAERAFMPPLGTPWFAPSEAFDAVRGDEHTPQYREWTFELTSQNLEMLPWQGTDFRGEAFITRETSGLSSYQAAVEEGWIEGAYTRNRVTGQDHSDLRWADISVVYFLRHLGLPDVLSGQISGEVAFGAETERDEEGLTGEGSFTITDGQFSADFILAQLEQRMDGDASALPPSLRFSELSTNIAFDAQHVRTPYLRLVSEGIEIQADGQFEPQGEMEYDLTVSITPDTAERIQVLGDYLNIPGHRLANQNIDLAFRMTGPTFSPKGELTQAPPVSVTLVTGGLGMVSEAVRVIDTPRKLLVDLLRMGGGIVGGASRNNQ